MKIWYLSAYDQPRGQSTRTYDFSKELVQRGHNVSFFTNSYCHFTNVERLQTDESWRLEMVDGIRMIWLKTRPYQGNGLGRGLNMLDNVRRILQASKALGEQPDILIGPSVPILTGWVAAYLAERYKVPFIYEVRDVWPDALVDNGGLSKVNPLYLIFRYIEKLLYRKATQISSTLPCLAEHVAASGSDPAKIVWIPNGIDLSAYKDEGYDGSVGRPLVVMYVGGFGLDHDVPTIIQAAKQLQDTGNTDFRFTITGDGVRKAECEKRARVYQLSNLEFRDPVPKSNLPQVQKEADIFIAAITNSKSFRFGLNLNKLCAYFASARPVLFSGNPPNNPVQESGAGLAIMAEEPHAMVAALKKLASMDAPTRMQMGQCGQRYAQTRLSMDMLGERMEKMLIAAIVEHQGAGVVV